MTPKPRKHNPKWKDNTSTQRSRARVADLNAIAVLFGYPTWRKFETSILRKYAKRVKPSPLPRERKSTSQTTGAFCCLQVARVIE